MKKSFIVLLLSVAFISCKKDKVADTSTGTLELNFDNIAGSADLVLTTGAYTNASSQDMKITKFDYYISNIILKKTDGSTYTVPQDSSYFLVKESDESSQHIELDDIPVGDYNGITFTLGVDSLRCTMDVSKRTGALDPANGMYWSWNSGYIFLKLEGTSTASAMSGNAFQYHIGGFGGMTSPTINNIKTISLSFPSTGKVRTTNHVEAHILADALKVLDGSTNISIATSPMVMFSAASVDIANNYKNMFIVDHIHND